MTYAKQSMLVRSNKYPSGPRSPSLGKSEVLGPLKQEHSTILRKLYEMDQQLGLLESSGPIRAGKILRELVQNSREMGENLCLHIQKEEEVLFSVLEERLGSEAEPVEVMREEHRGLLRLLASLKSEIERMIRDRDTLRTWNLTSRLQELRLGLSDHVSKEERLLFWLAEVRLSGLDLQKIASDLRETAETSQVSLKPDSRFPVNKLGGTP